MSEILDPPATKIGIELYSITSLNDSISPVKGTLMKSGPNPVEAAMEA